jgi:2TM domain
MPPRWSRVPTRDDPDYRRLDDRVTFATHVAAFTALNSGMWFVRMMEQADWAWSPYVTGIWFTALVFHAVYVFAIADYSGAPKAPGTD